MIPPYYVTVNVHHPKITLTLCRPHLNVITGPHKRRTVGTLSVPQQLTLPDVGVGTTATSSFNKSLELAASQASKSVELAASQSVRVRVENRLLLVPVPMPEQQTIGWLAREAARRYCRLVQVLSYLYITRDFEKL
jgi:hypothetical protein